MIMEEIAEDVHGQYSDTGSGRHSKKYTRDEETDSKCFSDNDGALSHRPHSEQEIDFNFIEPEVQIHMTDDSDEDVLEISEFNCGCTQATGNTSCSALFDPGELTEMLREARNLDYYDNHLCNRLDVVILGQLRALLCCNSENLKRSHQIQEVRKHNRTTYRIRGEVVCKRTFYFSFGISESRFLRLLKIYNSEGVREKPHGDTKNENSTQPKKRIRMADESGEDVIKISEFNCGCTQATGKTPCSALFDPEELIEMRREARSLDYYDSHHCNRLDIVILGQLRALCCDSENLKRSHKIQEVRKRNRTTYRIRGEVVCKRTFYFSFGISKSRFMRLLKIYTSEGVCEKPHGSTKNKNATKKDPISEKQIRIADDSGEDVIKILEFNCGSTHVDRFPRERQAYLCEEIRQFCPPEAKDILCPEPSPLDEPAGKSCSSAQENGARISSDEEITDEPKISKPKCGQPRKNPACEIVVKSCPALVKCGRGRPPKSKSLEKN